MKLCPRLRSAHLRIALLHGSMLVAPALLLAQHRAAAQALPANAAPQGGRVVGGAATIGQGPATTTITQSTDRAVIDWRSFDVGRDHSVQFRQPATTSMTLNRVTGPDPSVIAGRITANGGIALINQSGVVFAGGSQVQAQSVIVSTNDIANAGFMRGGAMVFDRSGKPSARIENNGSITARQAGLAALVAPQVANHGVIAARMGTVVLAGATQQVIDLNGDGLVSFQITGAVRTPPANGAALVANTGSARADGGTVLITAAAADGIVQNLVRAGGSIAAGTDPATGRTGTVLLSGTGGSIIIEGSVAATGTAPGTTGGRIAATANRVLVAGTARIDASGRAGGGGIAIGVNGPTVADRTGIAAGAVVHSDATRAGKGGQVVVRARQATAMAGTVTARGGPQGGDGGTVEVSSGGGLQLTGAIDVSAVAGTLGQVIIDPQFLTIVADADPRVNVTSGDLADLILANADAPTDAFLGAGQVGAITGNLVLQATDSITVGAAITKPLGGLALETGGTLTINAPVVLGAGDLTLFGRIIALNELVQVSNAATVLLDHAGSDFPSSVTEAGAGRITAGTLTQGRLLFDDITLGGANLVGQIIDLRALNTVLFNNTQSLLVSGTVSGSGAVSIDVRGGDLSLTGLVSSAGAAQLRASGGITLAAAGQVDAAGISLAAAFDFTAGTVALANPGGITMNGLLLSFSDGGIETIQLAAGAGGITQGTGYLQGSTLTVRSGGDASLASVQPVFDGSNQLLALGPSSVAGNFSLAAYNIGSGGTIGLGGDLALIGDIAAGGTLGLRAIDSGLTQQSGSRLFAARLDATAVNTGGLTLAGDNQVASLGALAGTAITFRNVVGLAVAGPVQSGGGLAITVAGGNLTVDGLVSAVDTTLLLRASGDVAVSATGTVTTFGSSTLGGISILAAAPDSGFDATLPGGVQLAGGIATGFGRLSIGAGTGGIVQGGGQILASQLTLQSGGAALLNGAGAGSPNAITGALLDVSAAGDFALDNDGTALVVAGQVAAANILLRTTAAIGLGQFCDTIATVCVPVPATLNAGAGRVSLQAGGIVFGNPANSVTGGLVEIAPATPENLLAGGAAGSTVAGALSVNQDVLTRITAQTLRLGATTGIAPTPGGTTASTVQVVAPLAFAGTLDLRSLGDITQAGGAALTIGTLTGIAGGVITLADPANSIGAVGDLSAAGDIALTVAGAMSLTGLLSAPGQTVALIATTGIAETGAGRIAAGTLAATTGGDILLAGANQVGQLDASSAAGNLTFNDDLAFTVPAGATVQADGTLSLATPAALTLAGQLNAASVVLAAAGGIAETGAGAIAAPVLAVASSGGDIALGGANAVEQLGGSSAAGNLAFNDSLALTVPAGATVQAGGALSLSTAGSLTLAGQLAAASVGLIAVVDVTEAGAGAIATPLLTVASAGGNVLLAGANTVDQLGASNAAGNFIFNDDAGLTAAAGATVQAGAALSMATAGSLTLAGQLIAADVLLTAATGIAETGAGAIVTPALTARTTGGDIVLSGANEVDAIKDAATPGQFRFADAAPLLTIGIESAIRAAGGITLALAGALQLDGALLAAGAPVDIAATAMTEGATGLIQADLLTLRAAEGDIVLGGPNAVDRLGASFTPGNLTFHDTAALTVPAGTEVRALGDAAITGDADIVVDGTVRGNTLSLGAATLLAVNGFSAIADAGPLTLTGQTVATTGLIASGRDILVAATSASLAGRATGAALNITAPSMLFGGLDAATMQVNLFLGAAGTAAGTLNSAGLLVAGGSTARLFGVLAGVAGGPAAALGRRADTNGVPLPPPPPNPADFTLNDCPIAVAVCHPLQVAPLTVATAPGPMLDNMDPRRFNELLTDTWLLLPTPTDVYLRAQPIRDPQEDLDLAPPNIRAEDF
ncbi:MAG: hypothetical protein BGP12_11425 [Rhodospirillales bacterium 70-18]|nr:MAG: hypothetical protein BGP12_11425 [Rhodospirillales bacterium 70-18]